MTYKQKYYELQNEVSLCYEAFLKTDNAVTEIGGFADIRLPNKYLKEYAAWQNAVLNLQRFMSYSKSVNAQPNDIFTVDTIEEKLLSKLKLTATIVFINGTKGIYGIHEIDTNLKIVQIVTGKGLKDLQDLTQRKRGMFQEVLPEEEAAIINDNLLKVPFNEIMEVYP